MRNILLVIDMQNDFIDGSLGTKEAVGIVDAVVQEIGKYDPADVFATRDTHPVNYLETQEGRNLPVEHCIKGTPGWEIAGAVQEALGTAQVIDKPTFGSVELAEKIKSIYDTEGIEQIILVGLCTDICVVSNALLLKAYMPELKIAVRSDCCAGVIPESHVAALQTMRMCQIEIL